MSATTELFSELELDARRLIDAYRTARAMDITTTEIILLNVWEAKWSAALPLEQIIRIGEALNNHTLNTDVSMMLSRMVRHKLLRSFASCGVRYYEVNF
jgi:hypothetical protein